MKDKKYDYVTIVRTGNDYWIKDPDRNNLLLICDDGARAMMYASWMSNTVRIFNSIVLKEGQSIRQTDDGQIVMD